MKQRKMEEARRRMEENTVSEHRTGDTKTPRCRFPRCLLDKVGSLSEWMPRVFVYFILFQKKVYGEAEGRTGHKTMSFYDYFTYHDSNGLCWSKAVSR